MCLGKFGTDLRRKGHLLRAMDDVGHYFPAYGPSLARTITALQRNSMSTLLNGEEKPPAASFRLSEPEQHSFVSPRLGRPFPLRIKNEPKAGHAKPPPSGEIKAYDGMAKRDKISSHL